MKAHLRRTIALLSLLGVVLSLLFAGQSYFFCPWMERVAIGCCCPSERSSADGPRISRAPCCSRTTLATVPGASLESHREASTVTAANAFSGELILIADLAGNSGTERTAWQRERVARDGLPRDLFELFSAYLI